MQNFSSKTSKHNPVTYGKIYTAWPNEIYLKNTGWFKNQGQELNTAPAMKNTYLWEPENNEMKNN